GASAANCRRLSRAITATPAPALSAASTKSWPSRLSPLMAKNASPLPMVRVSIDSPETSAGSAPDFSARMALAISSTVQSAVIRPPRSRFFYPRPCGEGRSPSSCEVCGAGVVARIFQMQCPPPARDLRSFAVLPTKGRASEGIARPMNVSYLFLQRRGDSIVIGERQHLVADDLPCLMALAGD